MILSIFKEYNTSRIIMLFIPIHYIPKYIQIFIKEINSTDTNININIKELNRPTILLEFKTNIDNLHQYKEH